MKHFFFTFLALLTAASLHAGGVLSGSVTCGGKPVPDVKVTDGKTVVLTGADGRYSFASDKASGLVFITVPAGYVP